MGFYEPSLLTLTYIEMTAEPFYICQGQKPVRYAEDFSLNLEGSKQLVADFSKTLWGSNFILVELTFYLLDIILLPWTLCRKPFGWNNSPVASVFTFLLAGLLTRCNPQSRQRTILSLQYVGKLSHEKCKSSTFTPERWKVELHVTRSCSSCPVFGDK